MNNQYLENGTDQRDREGQNRRDCFAFDDQGKS